MTESRACSCWQQVTLHDGHCCFIDVPDDHPIGTPPPCGHDYWTEEDTP